MKITDRFQGDHKTFRKLLRDLSPLAGKPPAEGDGKRLLRLVELFKDHLVLHDWGEETFYYPAVKRRLSVGGPVTPAAIEALPAEHGVIDTLIDRLEREARSTPPAADWPRTFEAFAAALVAHMDKEENEIFPFSEGLLGAEGLEEISRELERRRKEAPPIRRHSSS